MQNHTLVIENKEYILSDTEYKRMKKATWKEIKGTIDGNFYIAKRKKFLLDNGREVALLERVK